MVVPRDIRHRIERADFDAVELAWLEDMENQAEDIEHFVGIGRALVGASQGDLARTLLELLDEELKIRDLQALRLELLRSAGPVMVPKGRFHSAVLTTLRDLHGSNPSLEGLIETLALDRAHKEPSQTWDRVARLESLLLFTVDTVVWVEGHGPGAVVEVNYGLESFKVALETGADIRVGFRAAPKLLDALEDDHFLVRKRNDLDTFAAMKPPQVLEHVLTSFDRPMTGAEIRDAVQGLVDRSRWNSWWTSAKKHPQVVASTEIRNAYSWAGTTEEASDALWERFKRARPKERVELLRKASTQDEELIDKMSMALLDHAATASSSSPGLAFEIYCALDKPGKAPEDALEELVTNANWRLLIEGLQGRQLRLRAYNLVREYREEWVDLFAEAMSKEPEAALLSHLAAALAESHRETLDRLIQKAVAQPVATPALFTWVAEEAARDERLLDRYRGRLFRKILDAPGREAFRGYRRRFIPMCESGGTLPKLLGYLSPEEAPDALEAIQRASGYSTDDRQGLSDALVLKFPSLDETEDPLWALASSIDTKHAELKEVVENEIPENRRAIETAREMGDLRENFEYKAARQRHELLTSRAEALATELARVRAVDLARVDCSQVRVGTCVSVRAGDGQTRDITLLGPWESDPDRDVLSYLSEVGQALLGAGPGASVDLRDGSVEVVEIHPAQPPEASP
ncbi:MAG: GreA/GreB family elongation factor [Acidobacteriota bacterium]|nr:GreA/GreB family elongation factor [Acidobacteriota bacterium]